MKKTLFAWLMAGLVTSLGAAEPAATNYPAPAAAAAPAPAPAKRRALTPQQRAEYSALTTGETELNAEIKLLAELVELHVSRAEEASRAGAAEKSLWEGLLAQEFRARSASLLAKLNDTTKQRLAFEAEQMAPADAGHPGGENTRPLNANEFEYLSRLDQRLLQVREEMAAINETTKTLYAELATNSTSEAVTRISSLLDDNAFRGKTCEREQADLELKKLEFRALRK